MADTRLKDVAHSLFDNIISGLESEGVDVPTRRYTHNGNWAADLAGEDCASAFIVAWTGLLPGLPPAEVAGTAIKCSVPLTASYQIVLLRCVPIVDARGNAPTPTQLIASGDEIQLDGMTLPRVVVDKQLQGALTDIQCGLVGIIGVNPYGPEGGVGGTIVDILVSLV